MPRMPEFEIKAKPVTEAEQRSDVRSVWAEVTLDISANGNRRTIELTRAGGEALLQELHGALHPWAGHSIIDDLWKELLAVVGQLLAEFPNGMKDVKNTPEAGAYGELRGHARGLAYAIAVMRNPYKPNVDAVKREALDLVKGQEK